MTWKYFVFKNKDGEYETEMRMGSDTRPAFEDMDSCDPITHAYLRNVIEALRRRHPGLKMTRKWETVDLTPSAWLYGTGQWLIEFEEVRP